MSESRHWRHAEVADRVDALADQRYLEPFARGGTTLGLYRPRGEDPQQPHDRDEFYFVVEGTGWFEHGDQRTPFEPGDALFVAAGVRHRFVDFSPEFSAWVVFWPANSEADAHP